MGEVVDIEEAAHARRVRDMKARGLGHLVCDESNTFICQHNDPCGECGARSAYLCDAETEHGTCDMPMCEAHRHNAGTDRDLCFVHAPKRRGSAR